MTGPADSAPTGSDPTGSDPTGSDPTDDPPRVDHIVYAAVDLDAAVEDIAGRFGVRPAAGGRHVGVGTRNYLLSLALPGERGPYLELIGPDPSQDVPAGAPLPFGIEALGGPKLVGFALGAPDLDTLVAGARAAGHDPGDVHAMQRATPDGGMLSWRLTRGGSHDGMVPFLIDWLDSPHPSTTTPTGATLVALRVEHPDPAAVLAAHRALRWNMDVAAGPVPALVATIDTPKGRLELR